MTVPLKSRGDCGRRTTMRVRYGWPELTSLAGDGAGSSTRVEHGCAGHHEGDLLQRLRVVADHDEAPIGFAIAAAHLLRRRRGDLGPLVPQQMRTTDAAGRHEPLDG